MPRYLTPPGTPVRAAALRAARTLSIPVPNKPVSHRRPSKKTDFSREISPDRHTSLWIDGRVAVANA